MNPRQDFNEDTEQALGPALFSFNSLTTLCEDETINKHGSDAKATPSTSEPRLHESSDGSISTYSPVTWDGPEDPENPKNWDRRQKWTTSLIISSFAFLSPLSSSIAAPALGPISHDLHITNEVERQLVLSIFLLTYALGPFMGSGVLADCWKPEERGKGIAFMQFAPILGLAVGPIAGGYISQYATWRWTFWSVVILNFTVQVIAFILLRETYAPRLLHLKAKRLRKLYNDASIKTEWEKQERTLAVILKTSLSRPWIMLATQPIIQSLALYQAFNFGLLYLIITSFPRLWEHYYGMQKGQASLNYISIAVGALIGVLISAPTMDMIYQRLKRRRGIEKNEKGVPEFRIPLMVPASLLTPCGILLFAWTAQNKMHFMLPNVGIAITIGSSMVSYQCISAYIADCYALHTASASAACCFMRSMFAFAFPLFVPALFRNLGYGLGGSLLAIIAVVIGVPAPLLLWRYGAKLRTLSKFGVAE
ncbi:major facilitator superfamily transporter [Colletotrichum nymphaeae SA-01]|uniref:Major facilitator superfamily transporter n=1 Tax=Colletotrichum nymphaeae SA-01 TaxID=1460502 RepID=A0A135T0Q0_9PEZI|nr:major facilitator superfamily transporter [Colletotrichum nymphaeae SA-01]